MAITGNRRFLGPLAILLIVVVAVVLFLIFHNNDSNGGRSAANANCEATDTTRQASVQNKNFAYPADWQQLSLSDQDKSQGVLIKLNCGNPPVAFVWHIISGNLSKSVKIADLPAQISAKLKSQSTSFKLVSQKLTTVGKHQAILVIFDHQIDNKTYRTYLYVVPRPTQTDYLTFQTEPGNVERYQPAVRQLTDAYLTNINSSAKQ